MPSRPDPMESVSLFVGCVQTIERLVNRLKQYRRVATRYDERAACYCAFVLIAAIRLWL